MRLSDVTRGSVRGKMWGSGVAGEEARMKEVGWGCQFSGAGKEDVRI